MTPRRGRPVAMPRHLSPAGRLEWRALAPAARANGTLTRSTARAFAVLAETLATERTAAEIVAAGGLVVTTAAKSMKPHPAVRSLEVARAQLVPLLKSFRLLPADAPKRAAKASGAPHQLNGKDSIWHGVLK